MKTILRRALPLFIALLCALPTQALSATSAIVMEMESGRILYAQNEEEIRSIASITKLMTALVAIEENHDLQAVVTIGAESCGIEGSSLYLRPGEEITLEALLYGLMLRSGNDGAHAIALYTSGSVEAFAQLMNQKAAELGMENSHFVNPNGLEAEGHYSTARDMAILGCACLENGALAEIVATQTIQFGDRIFQNHNKLLWNYHGCVGMKTGYTEVAGRTLVSAATQEGLTLVAVTLNAPDDWADHTALLDGAFQDYQLAEIVERGTVLAQIPTSGALVPFVPVVAEASASYPVTAGETITTELILNCSQLETAVEAGEMAGRLCYFLNDIQVGEVPLVYGSAVAQLTVEPQTMWQRFCHLFE